MGVLYIEKSKVPDKELFENAVKAKWADVEIEVGRFIELADGICILH